MSSALRGLALGATVAAGVLHAPHARAVQFTLGDGAVRGSFDSTLSFGMSVRAESPDSRWVGMVDAIPGNPSGGQIGNSRVDKWDVISTPLKGNHELLLEFGERLSFFTRGAWFWDPEQDHLLEADDRWLDYDAADNRASQHGDLLDAYLTARFRPLDRPVVVKLGQQVISWGESTFIGNSINAINPLDISKLRLPGSELKEGLVPVAAAYLSVGLTANLQLETFYLLDWKETRIDPAGTYWANAEPFADGGRYLRALTRGGPVALRRIGDDNPDKDGQWGLALRYYLDSIGAEFSGYYLNVHAQGLNLNGRSTFCVNPMTCPVIVPPPAGFDVGTGYPVVGEYFLTYPKNVEIFGAAFNTRLGSYAWSGEYSYRRNAPIQLAILPVAMGSVPVGSIFEGVARTGVSQFQTTVQRILGPRWGATQLSVIGEAGINHVHDFNDFSPDILNDPYTDRTSYGYVVRASLNYDRALFDQVNLIPNLALKHDVHGNSSELGGAKTWRDGRKQATLGVDWDFRTQWFGNVSYSWFWGGESHGNSHSDRDFISMSVGYQF
jgi:hypothetical protein